MIRIVGAIGACAREGCDCARIRVGAISARPSPVLGGSTSTSMLVKVEVVVAAASAALNKLSIYHSHAWNTITFRARHDLMST